MSCAFEQASIWTHVFIGACLFFYSVDFFFGGIARYGIINVVRRAMVPEFSKAIVAPPMEVDCLFESDRIL